MLGVHTAWGRTLKDVFQRYKALRGYDQRYQNGFDCQGLWIEVGVERALGLNSKREIEEYGLAEFAAPLPRRRRRVVARADRGIDPARPVDGLGQRLLHLQRHEHRVHLAVPEARARARLALPRPPLDRVVPPLRDVDLRSTSSSARTQDRADPSLFVRLPLLDHRASRSSSGRRRRGRCRRTSPRPSSPDAEYGLREDGEWVAVARYPGRAFAQRRRGRSSSGSSTKAPYDDLLGRHRGRASRDPLGRGQPRQKERGSSTSRPAAGPRTSSSRACTTCRCSCPSTRPAASTTTTAGCTGSRPSRRRSRSSATSSERGRLVEAGLHEHRYPDCWRCHTPLIFRISDDWFIARRGAARSRCGTRTRRSSGRPPTWASGWTTGSSTWATGTSRGGATTACRCPSTPAIAAT